MTCVLKGEWVSMEKSIDIIVVVYKLSSLNSCLSLKELRDMQLFLVVLMSL